MNNLKKQLKNAIDYCNEKLTDKGITKPATNIIEIGNKIEEIVSDNPLYNYMYTFRLVDNIQELCDEDGTLTIDLPLHCDNMNIFSNDWDSRPKTKKLVLTKTQGQEEYPIKSFISITQTGGVEGSLLYEIDFTGINTSKCTNFNQSNQSYYTSVNKMCGIFDLSSQTKNCTDNSTIFNRKLSNGFTFAEETINVNFRFTGATATNSYVQDTLNSLIGGLKTLPEGSSQKTLILSAELFNLLSDEQKSIIEQKGWAYSSL